MNRRLSMLGALLCALLVMGFGASSAAADTVTIDALDDGEAGSRWSPPNVTIAPGDTVRWEFDQALLPHNVKSSSSNWSLRSPIRNGGDETPVEHTFEDPGTYTFLCEVHPSTMTGSVTVEDEQADPLEKVLVFSKTGGFRHDSIPAGIAAIQQLGAANDFAVDATEDATVFTDANLAQYDAVVFLSTTGEILNDEQQDAFERYIQAGNGFVGIHAASDTEYTWPWYGEMVGGYFRNHPPGTPTASVDIEDQDEPSTSSVPLRWTRTDEWYNFQSPVNPVVNGGGADYSPRASGVKVLATVDESTYDEQDGNATNDDHPVTWCSQFDGGVSWYTAMGHTAASFSEPDFREHLLGGLQTATGAAAADCGEARQATPSANDFEIVTIDDDTESPMELDVAPDGRVFYVERISGEINVYNPLTGGISTAAKIPVSSVQENGLMGIQLAPDFASTGHVYVTYTPITPNNQTRVSRFTVGAGNSIALSSEQIIYTWEAQREQCCHSSGSLAFGPNGTLFIAIGDNTNPFASDGYAPIDERPGRAFWDAQRTSANTNNPNGKIMRITPIPGVTGATPGVGSTYTIPEGNLFPEAQDTENKTLPEIYAMGFRNPFRITVDPKTGNVLLGDYGPDANSTNPNRGPQGSVEYNVVTPGNYGWPYCVRNNVAYNDYNFATSTSGAKFDCANPVNNSPNNTGLTNLPPAQPAVAWMGYSETDPRHPNLGPGGAPTGGPRYDFDPELESPTKFPEYFDGHWFIGEWNNGWIKTATLNEQNEITSVNATPWMDTFARVHEMEFGPDGSLYVIDWGTGFGGNNANSGIFRIDYVAGSRRPVAQATATPDSGATPLEVQFSSEGSVDPDGTSLTYSWDFNGDGVEDSNQPNPTFTFAQAGGYDVLLRVTDQQGQIATDTVRVVAGNTRPTVEILIPEDGQFADFGDIIPYEIRVTDTEDGTIDCTKVRLSVQLGHEDHAHGLSQQNGCSGTFQTGGDGGHGATANVFLSIVATYTDASVGAAPALTGQDDAILHTRRKRAEYFDSTGRITGGSTAGTAGVQQEATGDAGGGENIGFIEHGDYISFERVNLEELTALRFRVASAGAGGTIQLRLDSPDGAVVAETATIAPTGGWQNWQTVTLPLANPPEGTHELFIVFNNPAAGANSLMNLNWFEAVGKGAAVSASPEVQATATPATGAAPLAVSFNGQATDPDAAAGEQLSYAWDFGVPGSTTDTSTQQNPTFTYERAGTYMARLTVTDPQGARGTTTVEVRATAATGECPQNNVRSDEFEGSSLDTQRWNVVRPDEANPFEVAGGSLRLPIANGSVYGAGTTAKNIIVQPLPDGDVEVTAKITTEPLTENYHQAGLRVYSGDDNWASVHMIHAGGNRDIEFITETNGNPRNEAADKVGGLEATAPLTYYVRLTSDGDQLTAEYSFDGDTFLPVGRPVSLETFTNPQVGPAALSDLAPSVPMASFDWIRFDPDNATGGGGGGGGITDEFDGSDVGSAWDVVRRDQQLVVGGGTLQIPAAPGDLYGGRNDAANLVVRDAPDGAWEAITKINFEGTAQYQQAGIMVYGDDQNFTKFGRIAHSGAGDEKFEFIYENNGTPRNEAADSTANIPASFPDDFWVRLTSDGTNVTGAYSTDGTTWTSVGRAAPLPADAKIGLFAFSNDGVGNPVAAFDSFTLTGDAVGGGGGGGQPSGPSFDDQFEGSSLDTTRWNAIVRGDESAYAVNDGQLTITTQPGDIYTGDSNPPPNNFILQSAEHAGEDWTIETKMSGTISGGYAQGGLIAYSDGNNYVKFDPISDDGQTRINRIELRSEVGGQIANPQPNIDVPAGTTEISLRLTKAGNTYSGEYSFDGGTTWVEVPESVENAMAAPLFGVYAFGPLAAGVGETVSFDYFLVDGQDAPGGCECVAGPGDDFEAGSLDKQRWNAIVREDDTGYSLQDGWLNITTVAGDIYAAGDPAPTRNFILQNPTSTGQDWVIETHVDVSQMSEGYEQAGLLVRADDDNYVKFDALADQGNAAVNRIELRSEVNGAIQQPQPNVSPLPAGTDEVWLRLTKQGTSYSGEYSLNGTDWVALTGAVANPMEDPQFGLFTLGVNSPGGTARFEYLSVDGKTADCPGEEPDNAAPTIATATATPTTGFAPFEVDFAVNASDADGDQLTYSWDLDGDGDEDATGASPTFTFQQGGQYAAKVTVTDGNGGQATRTVQVTVFGADDPEARFRVLVFSKTAGFRHSSIDEGIAAIRKLGEDHGFQVDATEDASLFRDDVLERYDTVVFLSTTGDVLNGDQQAAFERYIKAGGGYTGIHAASDTEYTWPWYGKLVGAYFRNHPQNQNATVRVEDQEHPATAGLPASYTKFDEWYNFQSPMNPNVGGGGTDYSPRPDVHVLANIDEASYDEQDGNATDDDHPVTWCQRYDGGRSFYTAMGHTEATYTEANFLKQLLGGLETTAGVAANEECGVQEDEDGKPVIRAFADPDSGPVPLAVRFSATGVDPDGGELTYKWTFANGSAFGDSVSWTFRTAGTYEVTLTATDDEGQTASQTLEVVVGGAANKAPTVDATANKTSGNAALTVKFDAVGADPDGDDADLLYHWDFGDDNGTALEASPEHTYMEPGTYTATVTVSDPGGASSTDTVEITVSDPPSNGAPSVTVGALPQSGNAPMEVLFTATGTDPDGDALTYSWTFGDGATGAGNSANHVYTQAGTYQAVVTATDARGKTGTATVTVTVGNPRGNQAPTVQVAATPRRGTAPMKVTFTAAANDPDGDSMLYVWEFGDGRKAGGQKVTHTYSKPGTYTAKVTVDDLKGGTGTAEMTITVNPKANGQVRGQVRVGGTIGLRTFMSRGVRAKVTCAARHTGRATLSVSKATARKLGLRSATLATARVKCAKGKRATVRVKPSKRVARLLAAKQPRSVKATFVVRLKGKGKAVAQRTVTIKR